MAKMTRVYLEDHSERWTRQRINGMDEAFGAMAADAETLAKQVVPRDLSLLKASIVNVREGTIRYAVLANKEYAAYQERGEAKDGSRKVTHYTSPGTGKQYLERSVKNVLQNAFSYFKRHAGEGVR